MRIKLLILWIAISLPLGTAQGDNVDTPGHQDAALALAAFHDGAFLEAADLAEAQGDANSLALAARSILARAMCGDSQPPSDVLDRAENLARRTIDLDPGHVEGRLQLAIALSLKARPMSTREAMRAGYGDIAKELTESVLAEDPDNAYAHGLMAVWHVEVVRRGGAIGSAIMGASVRRGLEHYAMAVDLSPDDASIHWQMARALTALNARKYRGDIDAALAAALAANQDDALETIMAGRAATLSLALEQLPRREVERVAEDML